jgi:hypothetical protein
MLVPTLSAAHVRLVVERTAGPVIRVVEMLGTSDPEKLQTFRSELEALTSEYFENNVVHQGYLITRATKA